MAGYPALQSKIIENFKNQNYRLGPAKYLKFVDWIEHDVIHPIIDRNFDLTFIKNLMDRLYTNQFELKATHLNDNNPLSRIILINTVRKAILFHWVDHLTKTMGLDQIPDSQHFCIIVYGKTARGLSTGASDADTKFYLEIVHDNTSPVTLTKLNDLANQLNDAVRKSELFPSGIDRTYHIMETDKVINDMKENGFYGQLFLDGRILAGSMKLIENIFNGNPNYRHREKIRTAVVKFFQNEISKDDLALTNRFKLHQRLLDIYSAHLHLDQLPEELNDKTRLSSITIFNQRISFYQSSNFIRNPQIYRLAQLMVTLRHLYYCQNRSNSPEPELKEFNISRIQKIIETARENPMDWSILNSVLSQFTGKEYQHSPEAFNVLLQHMELIFEQLRLELNRRGNQIEPGMIGLEPS